jgi:hypothetical protein
MKNLDLRAEAKQRGVYFYDVAAVMGISEPTNRIKQEDVPAGIRPIEIPLSNSVAVG